MVEGWFKDEHYVLFEAGEVSIASARYSIARWLPGYEVLGLRGWDDLLRNSAGEVFTVPCVPLAPQHLSRATLPQPSALAEDARFKGQIKWYVMPLVFGGNPTESSNIQWVSHEQHGQLVAWWNDRYSQLRAPGSRWRLTIRSSGPPGWLSRYYCHVSGRRPLSSSVRHMEVTL